MTITFDFPPSWDCQICFLKMVAFILSPTCPLFYLISDVSHTHNSEKVLQLHDVIMCNGKGQSTIACSKDANLETALYGMPRVAAGGYFWGHSSEIVRLAYSLTTDFIRHNHEKNHSYFSAQQSGFTKSSRLLPTSMNKWNYHNLWPKIP